MTKRHRTKHQRRSQLSWQWVIGVVALVAIVAIAIVMIVYGRGGSTPGGLPTTVSVAEASAMRSAGVTVVDVSTSEEYVQAHIPGARSIPVAELSGRLSELPRDTDILVVCASGTRSAAARDLLLLNGFSRVTSLSGGLAAWMAAGQPTASGPEQD